MSFLVIWFWGGAGLTCITLTSKNLVPQRVMDV